MQYFVRLVRKPSGFSASQIAKRVFPKFRLLGKLKFWKKEKIFLDFLYYRIIIIFIDNVGFAIKVYFFVL
jgi:hypothetical protein